MSDIIVMKKDLADLALNLRARADMKVVGENVGGHRAQALREAPNMDVMNAKHTIHLNNIIHHIFNVHITGCGFEQNIHCIAQNAPGIVKDEEANQHTDQRIEPFGICKINDYAGNDRADRGEHITHQVDKSRTQAEIVLTTTMYEQRSNEIDNHRDETNTDEDA